MLQVAARHNCFCVAASWLYGCCEGDVPGVPVGLLKVGKHRGVLCAGSTLEWFQGIKGDDPRTDLGGLQGAAGCIRHKDSHVAIVASALCNFPYRNLSCQLLLPSYAWVAMTRAGR